MRSSILSDRLKKTFPIAQTVSDNPYVSTGNKFHEETVRRTLERTREGIIQTRRIQQQAVVNQYADNVRRATGLLNNNGFRPDEAVSTFEEQRMLGRMAIEGVEEDTRGGYIDDTVKREELLRNRIRELEDADQVAEFTDNAIEMGESGLEKVDEARAKIGGILRGMVAKLTGNDIDGSFVSGLLEIGNQLIQYGWGLTMEDLTFLKNFIQVQPGIGSMEKLIDTTQKMAEGPFKTAILSGDLNNKRIELIKSVSALAQEIVADLVDPMLDPGFIDKPMEVKQQLVNQFGGVFMSKTEPYRKVVGDFSLLGFSSNRDSRELLRHIALQKQEKELGRKLVKTELDELNAFVSNRPIEEVERQIITLVVDLTDKELREFGVGKNTIKLLRSLVEDTFERADEDLRPQPKEEDVVPQPGEKGIPEVFQDVKGVEMAPAQPPISLPESAPRTPPRTPPRRSAGKLKKAEMIEVLSVSSPNPVEARRELKKKSVREVRALYEEEIARQEEPGIDEGAEAAESTGVRRAIRPPRASGRPKREDMERLLMALGGSLL